MKEQQNPRPDRITKVTFLLPAGISLILIALQGLGEKAISLLRYDNTLMQTGEWWRLFTGHLIHLDRMHLLLNLTGLWILFSIFYSIVKPLQSLISFFILALAISSALLIFSPDVSWYVGFSGVLHGLIVIGALASLHRDTYMSILLLIGVSLKLVWEQFFADAHTMGHMISGIIIYDAHLYGAVAGVFVVAAFKLLPLSAHDIAK